MTQGVPQQQQPYGQMNPSPVGAGVVPPTQPNQYQQQQPQSQQQQQQPPQQQQTNFNYMQNQQAGASANVGGTGASKVQIWEGQIEWPEKDRNNPNIKTNCVAPAIMYSFANIDPNTGQYVSEVPVSVGQAWPPKITLQMMSKQILDILSPWCTPPARNLILYTDNQDVKNALTTVGV